MKLLPPLFIWSILGVCIFAITQRITWHDALEQIIRIPLQPVPAIGVYWFVYAIAGLYLLAPFISPWLHQASKKQIELFLCFWFINMFMPWITYFVPNLTSAFITNGNYYWSLCYFGGFLGYWILGWYLNKYPIKIGFNIKWITLLAGVIIYPTAICLIRLRGGEVIDLLDNLQIGSAFFVAFYYTLIQNITFKAPIQKVFSGIAKYSFGIYLTHIYIVQYIYWVVFSDSKLHTFPRTFLIAFLTLITGYALTYLLSLLPKGKHIIGV